MSVAEIARSGIVRNFLGAVVIVAGGLAANGLRGSFLDDGSAIGLYLAAFWLLTPVVLTPLIIVAMPGGAQDPPFFLLPFVVTIAVACALAGATFLLRSRLGARAGFAAFAGSMAVAVLVGAALPAMELRFSF